MIFLGVRLTSHHLQARREMFQCLFTSDSPFKSFYQFIHTEINIRKFKNNAENMNHKIGADEIAV